MSFVSPELGNAGFFETAGCPGASRNRQGDTAGQSGEAPQREREGQTKE
jgi:hypothetical protein